MIVTVKEKTSIFSALIIMAVILLGGCGDASETPAAPDVPVTNDSSIANNPPVIDEPSALKPLNLENDFIYFNITMEEADELFGEPQEIIVGQEGHLYEAGEYLRIYGDYNVVCTFYTDKNNNIYLSGIRITGGDYAPVLGIKLGDTIEDVLSKIALGSDDGITYREAVYIADIIYDGSSLVFYDNSSNDFAGMLSFGFDSDIDDTILSIGVSIQRQAPPKPLNLQYHFAFLHMSAENADNWFGEPLSVEESDSSGANLMYRIYEGISCVFEINEDGNSRLINLWVLFPGYAPVMGIDIGDSLESVLSKIALGENDSITYNVEMYRYELLDTYFGTAVSFSNWDESYSVRGSMEIDFDENDEVYFMRIILHY
jgi:hypothetical protein